MNIQLYHGDCLEEMSKIADNSVEMVLCDLPSIPDGSVDLIAADLP